MGAANPWRRRIFSLYWNFHYFGVTDIAGDVVASAEELVTHHQHLRLSRKLEGVWGRGGVG